MGDILDKKEEEKHKKTSQLYVVRNLHTEFRDFNVQGFQDVGRTRSASNEHGRKDKLKLEAIRFFFVSKLEIRGILTNNLPLR